MQASFWAIYKRGRFLSRAMPEDERMEQRERFGAACLSLCLRHDARFCHDFLGTLCKVKDDEGGWEVYVDRYSQGWADILLMNRSRAVVIECKVGDNFLPKQDPWAGRAFVVPKKGYGWHFNQTYPRLKRHYLLLGATRKSAPMTVDGIMCKTARWADVARLAANEKPWLKDLHHSLANLDYPSFRDMKTDHLNISNLLEILQCHEVLESLAAKLGISDAKITHSVETDEESGSIVKGYVGIEVASFKKGQAKQSQVRNLIASSSKCCFWFGYEMGALTASSPRALLSVWIYCGTLTSANKVRKLLGVMPDWKLIPNEKAQKLVERNHLHFIGSSSKKNVGDLQRFMRLLGKFIPAI